MVYCRSLRRITDSMIADDDMVFVGNANLRGFSSHYIHDIFDESMFYEFLESDQAFTKRNLEAYINRTIGNFGSLTDRQFDMVVSKWIFRWFLGESETNKSDSFLSELEWII